MSNIVIINGPSYASPYAKLADELGLNITNNKHLLIEAPEQVSLAVFTGGEDVSPHLYGEEKHRTTGNSQSRDAEEVALFQAAKKHGIPMAGICRGSQFLCAMAGGKVVQDVTGHAIAGGHTIVATMPDDTLKVFEVTSSHHQMQYPFCLPEEDYKVIGWSEHQRSRHYAMSPSKVIAATDADDNLKSEPDIVWYPKIKAFAAQYHPEWMHKDSDGFTVYEELLSFYLKPEIIAHGQKRKAATKAAG